MKYEDLLEMMKQEREAFNNLPTSEKLRVNRERRVLSLLNVGYITPDEAKTYREQLNELPQERKGLVVAYYLLGIDSDLDQLPTMETSEQIGRVIASYHLQERGALQNGKTIADVLTTAERNKFVGELSAIHIQENIKRAENFVDNRRKRIKASLLNLLPLEIALSLSAPEPQGEEYDTIPYLRELLQERGYKGKGKSLSDGERKAIQEASIHYLDLIELSFLNGVGLLRYEEYKNYLSEDGSRWEKDLRYRDVYDEALTEFEIIYLLFDNATVLFYADGTAKDSLDFLNSFREALLTGEQKERYNELKGGKFSYLLQEAKQC